MRRSLETVKGSAVSPLKGDKLASGRKLRDASSVEEFRPGLDFPYPDDVTDYSDATADGDRRVLENVTPGGEAKKDDGADEEKDDGEGEPEEGEPEEDAEVDPVDGAERDGEVTETIQPGYRLGELVIRPARVAVGRYVPKPDDG